MTKVCPTCKQEKPLSGFYNNKARYDGKATQCKYCSKKYIEKNIDNISIRYKKYREDNVDFCIYYRAKSSSKKRKIQFCITKDDVKSILKERCEITGILFNNKINNINRASLDRIDSSKGYTPDNIQIIPRWYNQGKLFAEDISFQNILIESAKNIKQYRKKKINDIHQLKLQI